MNLRAAILKEHSKEQCDAIVAWVASSQKRFNELFHLFIHDEEYRVVQRAAWPVSYCVEAHPSLIDQHYESLVKKLREPGIHDAVKRNSIRFLQHVNIPQEWQGVVMDICFAYLSIPGESIATRAFSMTVLANMAKLYPEIIPELNLVIEAQAGNESPGIKSRSKKIIKELQKSQ
jgi:hypothetical protein